MQETATPSTHNSTPLPVIANVSRIVSSVTDRITGDRSDYPLMVAAACVEALKQFKIESRVMFGPMAWIEILEDSQPVWAGCWGEFFGFWVATQYGEVVDLNVSVAHRKRAHSAPQKKSTLSPPMLWAAEVPSFYRFQPEGLAELELTEERDRKWYEAVLREVREKCRPELIEGKEPEFPNEAILCPGRRILDDSEQSFKRLDRVLSVRGLPLPPF